MKAVIDLECDALVDPSHIWLAVCKSIEDNTYEIFRNITEEETERERFINYIERLRNTPGSLLIGHNLLGYDWPVLNSILKLGAEDVPAFCVDTLILSKLIDYSRDGHSIEDYGLEFGIPKGKFVDFSKYSQEMEDYCVRDVDICHRIYSRYLKYINRPESLSSIQTEHQFQRVANVLHTNGFAFNTERANKLLTKVTAELAVLDKDILEAFPPKLKLIREITPKETKYGTLSKTDFRWLGDGDITEYNGGPFCRCSWESFNPSSHKQIVSVLSNAGWRPTERTQTHIDTEREYSKLKYRKGLDTEKKELYDKLELFKKTGWKVNETNLDTLPLKAPAPAKTLAKRILLEARRRTLTEWLDLVCIEIKIEKESIAQLGLGINGLMILSTENVFDPQIENVKQEQNLLPEHFVQYLNIQLKKRESVDGTSGLITDLPSKILIEWLQSRKVNVSYVKENESSLSITLMPPEKSESCCVKTAIQILDGLKTKGLKYSIIQTRIRGKFLGIGAWTHRMAHQAPNTANIPNEFDTAGKKKLLGKELRSLWCAPKNRLLVGVDAEGIQLRIFAHYINDIEFTEALVRGRKDDKTDPHSLNQRVLGTHCKSRAAAKRFIYAMLLGAGTGKLAEILGCDIPAAEEALARLLTRYTGFAHLKETIIPADAKRGYFKGLDGRSVRISGETFSARKHLAMSGYLQNGEAVVMKLATLKWIDKLKDYDALLVNFVHDEWQVECPNNMNIALEIAKMMSDSLRIVGEDLALKCPLSGSYWNDDLKDYTIATNWAYTH